MSTQLSSKQQLSRIAAIIYQYLRLPLSDENIPGSFLEGVLAHVRDGERLNTYDFVDVINREEKIGWQIKSTKESTPVTWKRAKIPNSAQLIKASHESQKNLQQLGTAIINFCNQHAEESIQRYGLDEIYYSRLITFDNGSIKYFERKLCDKNNPQMFDQMRTNGNGLHLRVHQKKNNFQPYMALIDKAGRKFGLGTDLARINCISREKVSGGAKRQTLTLSSATRLQTKDSHWKNSSHFWKVYRNRFSSTAIFSANSGGTAFPS